jgi:hypothetical protein
MSNSMQRSKAQKEKHIESMQRMKMSDNMQRSKLRRGSILDHTRSEHENILGSVGNQL